MATKAATREATTMARQTTIQTITCGTVTPTDTGVEGGVDVDLTVALSDGTELSGSVTLVRDRDSRGMWRAYGDEPSTWVEAQLLDALAARLGHGSDLTVALAAVESEAVGAAMAAPSPVRTTDQWWAWHDADAERHSAELDEAERRCAAWVAGASDDGPEA
jgi:hypothetical protein